MVTVELQPKAKTKEGRKVARKTPRRMIVLRGIQRGMWEGEWVSSGDRGHDEELDFETRERRTAREATKAGGHCHLDGKLMLGVVIMAARLKWRENSLEMRKSEREGGHTLAE